MSDEPLCAKVPYEHRHEAQKVAHSLIKRSGKRATVYLCDTCDFYHITKQNRDRPAWKRRR